MKSRLLIIVIVIVLVVVMIIGSSIVYHVIYNDENSDMYGEFLTYENKHAGFKMKYPQEFMVNNIFNDTSYKIINSETDQVLVEVSDNVRFSSDISKFDKSSDIPFSFSVRIHEAISTVEELEKMVKNNPPFLLEKTKLGETDAWRGTIGNESDFHDGHVINTIYDNKSYSVFFLYPKDQTEIYKSIIDYIIDSFEFVN